MATKIITGKRPEVQRKTVIYTVTRERVDNRTWTISQELDAYKRSQGVPPEAEMKEVISPFEDLIEYRYEWWEVTL